jgi:hypothetical protein
MANEYTVIICHGIDAHVGSLVLGFSLRDWRRLVLVLGLGFVVVLTPF